MTRSRVAHIVLAWALLALGMHTGRATATQTEQPGAASSIVPSEAQSGAEATVDSEHLDALNRCREGIMDPVARPADQRRWAEQLLSYDSPEATALAVRLLDERDRPDVQRAICEVIADGARTRPDHLDAGFVQPLINLLGNESSELRSAAARALAILPDGDVAEELGKLAALKDVALPTRLAAIDALAPNIHKLEVVAQLISLLDVGDDQISERVFAVLSPASREALGNDAQLWRDWWAQKKAMTKEAWLSDQIQIYRWRLVGLEGQYEACRQDSTRKLAAVAQRLRDFQREVFRHLPGEKKDFALVQWLSDPLPEVRLAALDVIKSQIADEGRRPDGPVLGALLDLLRNGALETRREVLRIVQNLSDPAVVRAVLAQLDTERDPATRHALLKALGALNRPEATPALIREIAAPDSATECVREAALALGQIMVKAPEGWNSEGAVAALKDRYHATPPSDRALRGALLSAMAGFGHEDFVPEFVAAVDSDDPAILRPAIDGLRTAGSRSKLPRLRDHTAHADAVVRLAAIDALGELGHEDADLECLLLRLNPDNEGNELVREAAWRAFRALLRPKPLDERLLAARRLRDWPEREIEYLEALREELHATTGAEEKLATVLSRLAELHMERMNYAQAAAQLRDLFQLRLRLDDPDAPAVGLEWLDAALHGFPQTQPAEVIAQLAVVEQTDMAALVDTVARSLAEEEDVNPTPRGRELLAHLETVDPETLPPQWQELLAQARIRLVPPGATETSSP